MTTFRNNMETAKRCLVVIGFVTLLLLPMGAPSAGDGGGGPPIPYDSTGLFDGDTTVPDTLLPSLN
ncbi:MAG TPA: hypothetical protein VM118_08545 [Acidobacteriota bacterium]|nr:hypothetical protein [Acidobacteriota bacterium]